MRFAGDEVRIFDFAPYVTGKIFSRIRDESQFANVWVALNTVSWGGGLDFDPCDLYSDSIPIEEYERQS